MEAAQNSVEQVRYQEILRELSQKKVAELEKFAQKLLQLIERKKSPEYRKKEQQLIEKIKNGGPTASFWKTYHQLADKSDEKRLTDEERLAFRTAIRVTREWDLERIKLMLELAQLWETSLDEVRIRLNIKPNEPSNV